MSDRILDDRKGLADRIEDRLDQRQSKGKSVRPVRETLERITEELPQGPYGKAGKGDVAAIVSYLAVKTGQVATIPIPGVRQPGFHVISHSVEPKQKFERHKIQVSAAYEDVARVASEYEVAAPSNIDFITSEVETVEVELLKERPTYNTYRFTVDIADRGSKEN